ncbi:LAETG motif-containing sortase-dependent surface protein [Yinghuangia seranimata]|uniref:LAETG motif-containing sortase-dependent surface protein n=1 Tax=Yinghuangia seranimata TaxID=408067 RepID=UPI00248B450C|nr:LAETG motif-containing sortase-dependent surface protein [Yinghuangia seranimata]MDI2127015.1 LAETG motif-containing sortase-dependent surface protein [Yinghuangia seranimata]
MGGALVAGQLAFAGGAGAADALKVTSSASTLRPGGPDATITIDASAPFEFDFAGTGEQSVGWQLPSECNNDKYPVVCTPGASHKVVVAIGILGGDQGGKAGQKVTFTAKAVEGDAKASTEITYGEPLVAADWVVVNPDVITYYNPGGKLAEPFRVQFWQGAASTDSAVLTVTGVKGVTFTKAPADCTIDSAGAVVTCAIPSVFGGNGPDYREFEGAISGDEQIVESKITGKLPENTPENNVDRTVYKNDVAPAPATPTASPSVVKPTPTATKKPVTKVTKAPAKGKELAATGADGGSDNTALIAGGAGALIALGAGSVFIARRRNRATGA